jgi:hypothetical protein
MTLRRCHCPQRAYTGFFEEPPLAGAFTTPFLVMIEVVSNQRRNLLRSTRREHMIIAGYDVELRAGHARSEMLADTEWLIGSASPQINKIGKVTCSIGRFPDAC